MNPQIPPIPSVSLVDERDGRISREWWIWFHRVFSVAVEQQSSITDQQSELDALKSGGLVPADPPIDIAQSVLAALSRLTPADPVDFSAIARFVLSLLPGNDDTICSDQTVLRAMMLSVPGDAGVTGVSMSVGSYRFFVDGDGGLKIAAPDGTLLTLMTA